MVRLKHRYLLLNVLYPSSATKGNDSLPRQLAFNSPTPDTLTPQILLRILRETIVHLFGDYGAGLTAPSLQIRYLSCPTSTAIVRVSRAHYRLVWAACCALTSLPIGDGKETEVVVRVARVSGTIRKAEEEVIRRGGEAIVRARREGRGEQTTTRVPRPVIDDDD